MKTERITIGTHIPTLFGELVVTYINSGRLVTLDEYNIDENENLVLAGERRLTLTEIASIFREMDGKNHRVVFDDPDEDEDE